MMRVIMLRLLQADVSPLRGLRGVRSGARAGGPERDELGRSLQTQTGEWLVFWFWSPPLFTFQKTFVTASSRAQRIEPDLEFPNGRFMEHTIRNKDLWVLSRRTSRVVSPVRYDESAVFITSLPRRAHRVWSACSLLTLRTYFAPKRDVSHLSCVWEKQAHNSTWHTISSRKAYEQSSSIEGRSLYKEHRNEYGEGECEEDKHGDDATRCKKWSACEPSRRGCFKNTTKFRLRCRVSVCLCVCGSYRRWRRGVNRVQRLPDRDSVLVQQGLPKRVRGLFLLHQLPALHALPGSPRVQDRAHLQIRLQELL